MICAAHAVHGLRTGEIEAPIRAAEFIVTTATPALFALVLAIYALMTAIFVFFGYMVALRLIKELRS